MTDPDYSKGIDPNSALARTQKWMGTNHDSTMCAQFVQEDLLNGRSGNYDDAKQWYNDASKKKWVRTSAPPAGVPVFYAGGKTGHGHVAISAGNGYVYSTDAQGNKVGKVRYDQVWGGKGSGQFLGWSSMVRTDRKGGYARVNFDKSSAGKDYIAPNLVPNGGVGNTGSAGGASGNPNASKQFTDNKTIGTTLQSARIM
jgi:hypothetical protein